MDHIDSFAGMNERSPIHELEELQVLKAEFLKSYNTLNSNEFEDFEES
jgi:hypothetical protein